MAVTVATYSVFGCSALNRTYVPLKWSNFHRNVNKIRKVGRKGSWELRLDHGVSST